MYEHLEAQPNAFHSLSVIPTVVSGFPINEFEMLDSRVQAVVGKNLCLCRENDRILLGNISCPPKSNILGFRRAGDIPEQNACMIV